MENQSIVYRLEIRHEDDEESWWKIVKVAYSKSQDDNPILDLMDYKKREYKYNDARIVKVSVEVVACL